MHVQCLNVNVIISVQNHVIERMWVEVNKRINYPLKEILVGMEQKEEICMDDPLHRFCCSWLISNVGAKLFVASWNAHPIPGMIVSYFLVPLSE